MARVLNLSEIIACLEELESPAADALHKSALVLAETAADLLAGRLGVDHGLADMWDGHLYVAFRPSHEGQEMPEILEDYDTDGEWE